MFQDHIILRKQNTIKKLYSNIGVNFFKRCKKPSLCKIVQHLQDIPPSNAFMEQVFSVTHNTLKNEGNCLIAETVRAIYGCI